MFWQYWFTSSAPHQPGFTKRDIWSQNLHPTLSCLRNAGHLCPLTNFISCFKLYQKLLTLKRHIARVFFKKKYKKKIFKLTWLVCWILASVSSLILTILEFCEENSNASALPEAQHSRMPALPAPPAFSNVKWFPGSWIIILITFSSNQIRLYLLWRH